MSPTTGELYTTVCLFGGC